MAGKARAAVSGHADQFGCVEALALQIRLKLGQCAGERFGTSDHDRRRHLNGRRACQHHARNVETGLRAVRGDQRLAGADLRARQRQPLTRQRKVPETADAERRPEHRFERLDIGDQSQRSSRHDDRIAAGRERRSCQVGDTFALTRDFHPKRQRNCLAHRRDDHRYIAGLQLGRNRTSGLARIRSADIEFQDAKAGLLDLPGHPHCRIEIGKDDAWDGVGIRTARASRSICTVCSSH